MVRQVIHTQLLLRAYPDITLLRWVCFLHDAGADKFYSYKLHSGNLEFKKSVPAESLAQAERYGEASLKWISCLCGW